MLPSGGPRAEQLRGGDRPGISMLGEKSEWDLGHRHMQGQKCRCAPAFHLQGRLVLQLPYTCTSRGPAHAAEGGQSRAQPATLIQHSILHGLCASVSLNATEWGSCDASQRYWEAKRRQQVASSLEGSKTYCWESTARQSWNSRT